MAVAWTASVVSSIDRAKRATRLFFVFLLLPFIYSSSYFFCAAAAVCALWVWICVFFHSFRQFCSERLRFSASKPFPTSVICDKKKKKENASFRDSNQMFYTGWRSQRSSRFSITQYVCCVYFFVDFPNDVSVFNEKMRNVYVQIDKNIEWSEQQQQQRRRRQQKIETKIASVSLACSGKLSYMATANFFRSSVFSLHKVLYCFVCSSHAQHHSTHNRLSLAYIVHKL